MLDNSIHDSKLTLTTISVLPFGMPNICEKLHWNPCTNAYIWNKFFSEILLKLFQCFISLVTTSETEIELFQPLKEFWNYFEIVSAKMNTLENIHELQ